MRQVKVRNIEIGAGIPKICVPIAGVTDEEIMAAAEAVRDSAADLAEWRADWYENVFDFEKTEETLRVLRNILGEMPVLFTFRTAEEGGEKVIDKKVYVELNRRAVQTGMLDLVDIEASAGDKVVKDIIETAREYGVKAVVSNHDFQKTPSREEILFRLRKMQELGADIAKIAVMPRSRKDVLTLLAATEEITSDPAQCPVITMSMGRDGVISRICGEAFGSAVTFGTVGRASAPGQMKAEELAALLELFHKNM